MQKKVNKVYCDINQLKPIMIELGLLNLFNGTNKHQFEYYGFGLKRLFQQNRKSPEENHEAHI